MPETGMTNADAFQVTDGALSHGGRRDWMKKIGLVAAGSGLAAAASRQGVEAAAPAEGGRFVYGLNTSTIRGQELDAAEEIEVAGKAGYEAIEPWFRKINAHVEAGG